MALKRGKILIMNLIIKMKNGTMMKIEIMKMSGMRISNLLGKITVVVILCCGALNTESFGVLVAQHQGKTDPHGDTSANLAINTLGVDGLSYIMGCNYL